MSSRARVLLVEDESLIALYLRSELGKAGYPVSAWVTTGEEGVAEASSGRADVVLMDIRLAGGIDGIEASLRIRKTSAIPIIFMSGYQDPGARARAVAVEPLAFLDKPLGLKTLLPLLERVG